MHAKRCTAQLKTVDTVYARDDASVFDAHMHVNATPLQLLALKEGNGKSLGKFISSFEQSGICKGVNIQKTERDDVEFLKLRSQFLQALHDNISSRFPATGIMLSASMLKPRGLRIH